MKRLLTHSQLKHTKQAANKFLTCFIATIMAVALSLPAAGIPTLSFADEPNQGSESVSSTDLEQGDGATDQINNIEGEDSGNSSNGSDAGSNNGIDSGLPNGSNTDSHFITDADITLDESTFNKNITALVSIRQFRLSKMLTEQMRLQFQLRAFPLVST